MSDTIENTETLAAETETTTALAVTKTAASNIVAADKDGILDALAKKVAAFKPDMSTGKGRDEIRSFAADIARDKNRLIKIGKSLTEEWRSRTKAVNTECNIIEANMDALRDKVRAPLTDWENAEKERVAGHERVLAAMEELAIPSDIDTSDILRMRGERLAEIYDRDWQLDFRARAADLYQQVCGKIEAQHARAVQRETEAAELARFRAQEAERQRIAAEEARKAHEAEIARQAADHARAEVERKAAEESARIERERLEAEAREAARIRAEQERIEAEKQDAERRATEAERAHREAVEQAKRADDNAKRMAQEAAERAERERQAAAAKAEQDRIAAIEAERQRIADEQRRAAEAEQARAADRAHKTRIHNEAMQDLINAGMKDAEARAAIIAIAAGKVRHLSVRY